MHLHLPKPLHGWRAFIGEVGIIVLGVLIALSAEQIVEAVHQHQLAIQTRRDVREEAAIGLSFNLDRLAESSCIFRRLDQLNAILDQGYIPEHAVTWVGRPGDYPILADRWHAVTASARSAMFPPQEQGDLDNLYAHFSRFQDFEKAEQAAWTDLRVMERLHGPIDPQARFSLMRAAEEARHEDFKIRSESRFVVAIANRLKLRPNLNYGTRSGEGLAVCLPLTTGEEQAARMLKSNHRLALERPD